MVLKLFNKIGIERRAAAGRAEGSVAEMAARTAGDLTEFGGYQTAMLPAVELPVGREGDMIDIEIEPHADSVGRNDIIDDAILEHIDLGVAGSRRQRAEDDRRAAALAPDPFRDRINILGGKGDDRAAPGQAGHFLVAGETQARETRTRKNPGAWQELPHRALHGGRADKQESRRARAY